ncbi:MAG: LLM class F420-dependent oxidoreductase [Novosphingobium sp.]|nr:LLM class F420-dependent oxidoreductase [Novosphingobium sp.]
MFVICCLPSPARLGKCRAMIKDADDPAESKAPASIVERMIPMHLDLHVTRFDWAGGPSAIGPGLMRLSRKAEAVGIRTLSVMDHFFQMDMVAPAEDPMLECYTTPGFIAGVTQSLRMRVLVSGVTYRHPGLLAKTMTTLDVLSGGRAELGLGAAWYEREHLGLGVPFPPIAERFERLEEALQICLQMWSENNGPFEGRHYRLAETLCSPLPVSSPRPRIMIGGGGERKTLRLVARYADACNFFGAPEVVAHKVEVLRRHCDEIGRDIREIEVTVLLSAQDNWTPDDVLRAAEAYGAAGVATVMAPAMGADPAGKLESLFAPALERLKAITPKAL